METTLAGLIKQKYRSGIKWHIILILVALVFFYFQRSYIKAKTLGSDEVTNLEEIMAHFDGGDPYVKIHADELYDEGYMIETITTNESGREISRKSTSFYVSAYIGDRYLLIELPYKLYDDESFPHSDVVISGFLSEPDSEVDAFGHVSKNMASEFGISQQEVRDGYLAPVFLNATNSESQNIFVPLALLMLLIALYFLILALVISANPKRHKVYKKMAEFGDAERIEREIDREISGSELIAKAGKYNFITTHYLLSNGKFTLSKTEDLAWAYRRTVKNRGVTTHSVCLRFQDGKTLHSVDVRNESESVNVLNAIDERIPVICGYSKDLEKMYQKDLPQFLSLLMQRKDEFYNHGEASDAAEAESVTTED